MRELGILTLVCASIAAASPRASAIELTAEQILKIERLSTVFENSTTEFQYGYLEDIGDGLGVTAGRIGFTSRTEDLLELAELYVKEEPKDNPLAPYLPCLRKIVGTSEYACLYPSVSESELRSEDFRHAGLISRDFGQAWLLAAADEGFRKLQDRLVRENVHAPARAAADELGIKTALGYAVVFDSILMQGASEDANSFWGMVRRTRKRFADCHGGKADPAAGADEKEWIRELVLERRQTLKRPYHPDDTPGDQDSRMIFYPRAESLLQLVDAGDFDLAGPLRFKYFNEDFEIR